MRKNVFLAVFLLTCLLRGMTNALAEHDSSLQVSTHMPLARHDTLCHRAEQGIYVSTHMPLARHDFKGKVAARAYDVSTHMPLARHDYAHQNLFCREKCFYSHASCEA